MEAERHPGTARFHGGSTIDSHFRCGLGRDGWTWWAGVVCQGMLEPLLEQSMVFGRKACHPNEVHPIAESTAKWILSISKGIGI